MKIRLVRDWRSGYKWFSTQAIALASLFGAYALLAEQFWVSIPAELKSAIDPELSGAVSFWLTLIGLAARFIDQKSRPERAVDDAVAAVKPELVDTVLTKGQDALVEKLEKVTK